MKIIHIIFTLMLLFGTQMCQAQQLFTPFPSTFRNTRDNELIEGKSLQSVFQKMHDKKTVKVMHIGDSHVKGNYLPRNVESTLKSYFPLIEFAYYGINGAWARRFYEEDMIQKVAIERPDLVIISFGTNEAHASSFDAVTHSQTMDLLTSRISARCPNVKFLFTTPPGSYISTRTGSYTTGKGRRRRTHYTTVKSKNDRTDAVARSIVQYCQHHKHACWDIFNIAGGINYACNNWFSSGLMATDQVHYLVGGYQLQGKLLGEAIYKAYIAVPAKGTQTRMMHGATPQEQTPYRTLKGF